MLFIQHHKALPQNLAKLLLCAILSDTLNLRSVKLVRLAEPRRAAPRQAEPRQAAPRAAPSLVL